MSAQSTSTQRVMGEVPMRDEKARDIWDQGEAMPAAVIAGAAEAAEKRARQHVVRAANVMISRLRNQRQETRSRSEATSMTVHHLGRLIDHVHLRVADVAASQRFYRAVFAALGVPDVLIEGEGHFHADELWVDRADGAVSRVHLAFQASSRAVVDAFHVAALAAGGRDNGAPGERPYHPGYYAAFVLDPDGNNIEAVHHGAASRSAASVTVTPD